MNGVSKRSEAQAAEALLEAGRTQPVLAYDVELGLMRHQQWLQSDAPVPEWASASVGTAANSLLAVLIKTIVSAVLIGALGTAAWHARSRLQPSASPVPPAEQPPQVSVSAAEPEPAPRPIPVPESSLHDEPPPPRRAAAADARDKRAIRAARPHKEAAARATTARAEPLAPQAVGAAPPAATPSVAPQSEVALQPARKQRSEQEPTRPEPRPQAQAPDDLAEMQQVASAEQLLERSPARALALVRQGDQRFAHGYFQQERAYIAIMALIKLDRIEEARVRAASFAKRFPALPYGARIRSALDGASP
jgi:hypothetical protein